MEISDLHLTVCAYMAVAKCEAIKSLRDRILIILAWPFLEAQTTLKSLPMPLFNNPLKMQY